MLTSGTGSPLSGCVASAAEVGVAQEAGDDELRLGLAVGVALGAQLGVEQHRQHRGLIGVEAVREIETDRGEERVVQLGGGDAQPGKVERRGVRERVPPRQRCGTVRRARRQQGRNHQTAEGSRHAHGFRW